jgi:ubiquinone/menaquinone biosynthesis C-methylase UbiE
MGERVCPVWVGYCLASRLRRLLHNPARVLEPYIKSNMTVLDIGSAMGFFSLPMAEMVGPRGKVVCVDVQTKMLDVLRRRAVRAGLADRVETHVCGEDAILHEVPDQAHLLTEIRQLLKPEATLLLAEPRGHVNRGQFDHSVSIAQESGFAIAGHPEIRRTYAVSLAKPR